MGHCGQMQLSKLAVSNLANDSWQVCQGGEGGNLPTGLAGQQCLSWKLLEFIEIKVHQRGEVEDSEKKAEAPSETRVAHTKSLVRKIQE